ncbi:MAG TPA: hypothetical protein VIK84_06510 [Haloplasmataceae bacterium]
MKIKSLISIILVVCVFLGSGIALFIYAANNEFVAPQKSGGDSYNLASPDSEIWDKTLDDLFAYLNEKGLLVGEKKLVTSDGYCSEAYNYNNIDFYYWDLKSGLSGDVKTAWEEANKEGGFMLYGQYWISVSLNGPFAMNIRMMGTNRDEILKAFESYCRNVDNEN